MFEALGFKADATRARQALVLLLVQQGRLNEAISNLFINRSTFLELQLPLVAAEAGLRIAEIMFAAGRIRDVKPLLIDMVETFRAARLPEEAMKALSYLAEAQRLDENKVTYVLEFLKRLQVASEGLFAPPHETQPS